MKNLKLLFVTIFSLYLLSGCTKETPENIAINFAKSKSYDLISLEDKSIFSKAEYDKNNLGRTEFDILLQPGSEYFLVEKYLKEMVTYRVTDSEKLDDKIKVTIEISYPEVLDSFWFWDIELMRKLQKDELKELQNIAALHEKKLIKKSDFHFKEKEIQLEITKSGVYINLKAIKEKIDLQARVSELSSTIEEILSQNSNLSSLLLRRDENNKFDKLMKETDLLPGNIERVEKVKNEILAIDPDNELYRINSYLSNAKEAIEVKNSFDALYNGLIFSNVKVQMSTRGSLAVFGDYKYTSNYKIKYLNAVIQFFDDNDDLIGKQNLDFFINDLYRGKVESFGRKIDDQHLARQATRVKIVPTAVFGRV